MWLATVTQLVALATTAPQLGLDSSASAPAMLPSPIATRQFVFTIPFRIQQPQQSSQEPVEVQLFASADRGRSWQLYSKVEPARRHFMFRAAGDGEYWFLVRTRDRSGVLRPQGPNKPELRVIVDTVLPKLKLQAQRGQAGQVTARWEIDEPNAKPGSLTIQCRASDTESWQPVAVDRQNSQTSATPQRGEVTWWPQGGTGELQVRAEVADAAGNVAVSETRVAPGYEATPPPEQTASGSSAPWRAGSESPASTSWPADQATNNTPWARNPGIAPQVPPDYAAAEEPAPQNDPHDYYAAQRNGGVGAEAVSYGNSGGAASADGYRRDNPSGAAAANVDSAIQNQYPLPGQQTSNVAENGLPPGERPRMVNSRMFELEYEVPSVSPWQVGRVELWGTRDGGRTWKSFATDDDNRSPLLVTVDEDGIYGFRVVVTDRSAPGDRAPQNGDLAEVWIGVDQTRPTARIIDTQQGTGPDANRLTISYQADDRMLTTRPISLSYSQRPGGPWTAIADNLENTGRYTWQLGDRMGGQIYLRLEVRDEAGNLGEFETAQAIALGRSHPTVYIRDVRPLDQSRRPGPKRYYFR